MSRRVLLGSALGLTLAYIGSGAAAPALIDWPTYGFDSIRSSNNKSETALSPETVGKLQQLWAFNAGTFDHTLNSKLIPGNSVMGGQAIVAAAVKVGTDTKNLVLIGDGNGTFFALDANTIAPAGSVVWFRPLGRKAVGDPVNTSFGIRSTATLDRTGAGVVYTADNVQVFGLDLASGETLPGWPVSLLPVGGDDTDGEIHDALNLVGDSLYVGTSGIDYDLPPYYGRVALISTSGHKVITNWFAQSGNSTQPTISGGGVWGWGGVSVDQNQKTGGVYVATGNTAGQPMQQTAYAENVVHLDRGLKMLGAATPSFPAKGDDDYGATPLVVTPKNCATKLIVTKNKTGLLVVDALAADGSLSVAQTLQVSREGGSEFKGTSAFDLFDQLVVLSVDAGTAPYAAGLAAFHVSATCSAPWLTLAWQTTQTTSGASILADGGHISSPTIAHGLVFFGAESPTTPGNSVIYAALARPYGNAKAGTVVWASSLISGVFDSALPTVVNGQVLFSTVSAAPTLYAFGLPGK